MAALLIKRISHVTIPAASYAETKVKKESSRYSEAQPTKKAARYFYRVTFTRFSRRTII
jgi:hypothetical protein